MKRLLIAAALLALTVPAVAGSEPSERATKKVGAYNNYFTPKKVTVGRGTKVTWVVRQGVHNVRGSVLNSPNMTRGGSYSKTFKRRGTFGYVCTLHAGMGGKVVVR